MGWRAFLFFCWRQGTHITIMPAHVASSIASSLHRIRGSCGGDEHMNVRRHIRFCFITIIAGYLFAPTLFGARPTTRPAESQPAPTTQKIGDKLSVTEHQVRIDGQVI